MKVVVGFITFLHILNVIKSQDCGLSERATSVPIDTPIGAVSDPQLSTKWPWTVLLVEGKATNDVKTPEFFCNGVLLNERFILTGAHCIRLNTKDYFIRLGEFDYEDSNDAIDIDVESVFVHPKYEYSRVFHDLAIIKLRQNVKLTNSIRPLCLPWNEHSNRDLLNKNAIVTGWGVVHDGGQISPKLQEIAMTIFNPSKCQESYSLTSDYQQLFPQGINLENLICAGPSKGGKDACHGFGGAPLFYNKPNTKQYFLAGIVSLGIGCGHGDYPGLFAPIRNQLNLQWIKDVAFSK